MPLVCINLKLTPLLEATVQVWRKPFSNAVVAAEMMEGINGNTAYALLPFEIIQSILLLSFMHRE